MREDIGKAVRVRAGDKVRIKLRLPKSADYARLSVWSAVQGYEFSPHVQHAASSMLVHSDKPELLRPLYATLSKTARVRVLEFVADEDLTVQVRQEKDVAADPSAKARISVDGTLTAQVRRHCRNFLRLVRRQHGRPDRAERRESVV